MAGRAGRTGHGAGDAFLILDSSDTSRDPKSGARRRLTVSEGAALLSGPLAMKCDCSFREPEILRRVLLELIVLHPKGGRLESQLRSFMTKTFFFRSLTGGSNHGSLQRDHYKEVDCFGKLWCAGEENVLSTISGLVKDALKFLISENFITSERSHKENAPGKDNRSMPDADAVGKTKADVWRFRATRLGIATVHSALECETVPIMRNHAC